MVILKKLLNTLKETKKYQQKSSHTTRSNHTNYKWEYMSGMSSGPKY